MGTHVHPWWIRVNVWQNQYSIVKQNKVKIKIKKKKNHHPKLEPVIQSEVSQKEKNKYHILMHIYASLVAQTVKNLPASQEIKV